MKVLHWLWCALPCVGVWALACSDRDDGNIADAGGTSATRGSGGARAAGNGGANSGGSSGSAGAATGGTGTNSEAGPGSPCPAAGSNVIDDLERNALYTFWSAYHDGSPAGTQSPSGQFAPERDPQSGSYAAHTSGDGFGSWGACI